MSSQWNQMIFFRRFHTIDLSSLMRRNPNSADAVMRTGLSSYLKNVNPEMTEEQISAMADANAVLMESLASAQGRTIADFVEGLTGLGVTDDPSLRGQYREENGARSIVLNPETMSPTTFSHEVGHYFLMTLPDGPVKDRIIDTYRAEYEADGNKIGTAVNEAFTKGLVEYTVSGVAVNEEVRSLFKRLLDAMRRFVDRIFRLGGLSAEQKALYDSFFSQDTTRRKAEVRALSEGEANSLIAQLEKTAEEYEYIEFTEETAKKEFSRTANTPVGEVKFGDNQAFKLEARDRTDNLGQIRPTLEHPSLVLREIGNSGNGNDAFEFFKVFRNSDGSNEWFLSVTVDISDANGLVAISSHTSNPRQLKGKLKKYPLAYVATAENQQAGNDGQRQRGISTRLSQNLTSDSSTVNSNDVVFNEAVDDENLSPEQRALRERIKRGRAAQAQRRRRFYENIDAMLDKNMYVESYDLRRYRSNLERELREAHENDPGFKFTDDARYRRVLEEYHARDMMLL